ncbi:hypothetical protein EXIGLDRAFT_335090 [Exidia glandulosa HHB12029]|uniref:Uncharacterized protein n=1 Tax=Exidia glandulosa HHB12029 TaxID=1314781 RepID=A0A165CN25_EXIGL|nr:hypothetical protein EXIGLDRAFT_335090 [Exidia glandulosa HHB12029]
MRFPGRLYLSLASSAASRPKFLIVRARLPTLPALFSHTRQMQASERRMVHFELVQPSVIVLPVPTLACCVLLLLGSSPRGPIACIFYSTRRIRLHCCGRHRLPTRGTRHKRHSEQQATSDGGDAPTSRQAGGNL